MGGRRRDGQPHTFRPWQVVACKAKDAVAFQVETGIVLRCGWCVERQSRLRVEQHLPGQWLPALVHSPQTNGRRHVAARRISSTEHFIGVHSPRPPSFALNPVNHRRILVQLHGVLELGSQPILDDVDLTARLFGNQAKAILELIH